MVCRLGALAASCLMGELGASAQFLPAGAVGFAANSNQANAPNLPSDIKPGDWAYQALQSLLKRPGCGALLASEAFRRSQGIPRGQAAILLNHYQVQG